MRGSFLSELLLPGAFFLRAAVFRAPMHSVPAGEPVVARLLRERCLLGRLTPDGPGFRHMLLLRHPLTSFIARV